MITQSIIIAEYDCTEIMYDYTGYNHTGYDHTEYDYTQYKLTEYHHTQYNHIITQSIITQSTVTSQISIYPSKATADSLEMLQISIDCSASSPFVPDPCICSASTGSVIQAERLGTFETDSGNDSGEVWGSITHLMRYRAP